MLYSKDLELGLQVHAHLKANGVETPFTPKKSDYSKIESLFSQILEESGLDLTDDSLRDTPKRLAKLYSTEEFFAGLDYSNFPKSTVVQNKMKFDEMVLERNIKVTSLCEHHALPIIGSAFIAYVPKDWVMGLSKLNRVVEFFCRRPQIQERLTMQIYYTLSYLLDTPNVAVIIQADHMCVKTRGVEDSCSDTITSFLGGDFRLPATRMEFIELSKGFRK